jgi:hypothetical protein
VLSSEQLLNQLAPINIFLLPIILFIEYTQNPLYFEGTLQYNSIFCVHNRTFSLEQVLNCFISVFAFLQIKERCHGLVNYKRHLNYISSFNRVYIDWRYNQSCWYFRTSFVNYCPSNLLSSSPPRPSPFPPIAKSK